MSISKPIYISYLCDREHFEKAFESSYAYHFQNSARRYIGWLFIAMAQFGVVAALKYGQIALLMLSTILLLYWYGLRKWIFKKRAMRAFENANFKERMIEIVVDQEGIREGDEILRWGEIDALIQTDKIFLLYHKGKELDIPFDGFRESEDINRFKKVAKSKGKLYV